MLRYATPWWVVAYLVFSFGWKAICKRLDRAGIHVPWMLRYYTALSIMLTLIVAMAIWSTLSEVLWKAPLLDPEDVEAAVRAIMEEENDLDSLDKWRAEASLADYPCLRRLSLLSPIFLLFTWVIVMCHVWWHVWVMHKTCGMDINHQNVESRLRDKVIRIVALPLFYGLMSFEGVVRMWGVTMNFVSVARPYHDWNARRVFLLDMWEAAILFSDFYESYALLVFGTMILRVLNAQIDSKIFKAQLEAGDSQSIRVWVRSKEDELVDRSVLESDALKRVESSRPELDRLIHSVNDLLHETKELTTLGIKLFFLTCGLQALYHITVNTLGFYRIAEEYFGTQRKHHNMGLLQTEESKQAIKMFFSGAGFIASFAAIGNILNIEHGFRAYLVDLGTFYKFLGVKILVSVAFFQQIALAVTPPFMYWSPVRVNLLYSSLLTAECLLISLLHMGAWAPTEDWYHTDRLNHELMREYIRKPSPCESTDGPVE